MLSHMAYTPLASVNGVSSSYLLSEALSVLALLNLFKQKKIADFSKLHFMLDSTLDHQVPSGRVEASCSTCDSHVEIRNWSME